MLSYFDKSYMLEDIDLGQKIVIEEISIEYFLVTQLPGCFFTIFFVVVLGRV